MVFGNEIRCINHYRGVKRRFLGRVKVWNFLMKDVGF